MLLSGNVEHATAGFIAKKTTPHITVQQMYSARAVLQALPMPTMAFTFTRKGSLYLSPGQLGYARLLVA